MVNGSYEDDVQGSNSSPKPAETQLSPLLTGSEYPSESGPIVCPPETEQAEPNDNGGYQGVTGKAVCAPELNEAESNTGGGYETPTTGNGAMPLPPHLEDCNCEDCCFYSEAIPNTQTVGGHKKNDVYNTVPVKEMWYTLLHPYQNPSIELTLDYNFQEVGSQLSVLQIDWLTNNSENTVNESTKFMKFVGLPPWILEQGFWNQNGIWKADGIWKTT